MNTPDRGGDPDGDPDGDFVRAVLDGAVCGVEPVDRLAAIQARTAEPSRRGRYAAGGAVLAAAAVVVAVAVVATGDGDGPTRGVGPAVATTRPDQTSSDPARLEAPSPGPTAPTEAPAGSRPRAIYYVGDTPEGPALFREFHRVGRSDAEQTVSLATTASADDPDYRTLWPGALDDVSLTGTGLAGSWTVTVPASLAERPEGMSEREAVLAVQQVVYTVQATGRTDAGVRFTGPTVLGVPVPDDGFTRDPDVVADVNISDPVEGRAVTGAFTARGVADSFEATVPWRVVDGGGEVVVSGAATASGFGRLHPWETTVDVSALAPGTYTFEASTSDPSDGEGAGPTTDTRSITVT
ncbi:Gmad2 immunoglobulin-like domain-containing protein [Nocardioides plantarum]|uniref:Gmad2 immunoglobulin-like domain-containing protein n=1 Tax=Nocardioides plantarum TaxID=29299 RepID=A0ABV5K635_9ACTN|nr:Gmad2 immunoglobulin-like domain-containing protein [Nocardioides plantarum]